MAYVMGVSSFESGKWKSLNINITQLCCANEYFTNPTADRGEHYSMKLKYCSLGRWLALQSGARDSDLLIVIAD